MTPAPTPVVAGIDIGNATTEVVLVAVGAEGRPTILAAERMPTRGRKGAAASIAGAVAVVRRCEHLADVRATCAVVAPLRAVDTGTATLTGGGEPTGRLRVVAPHSRTPGAPGQHVGRPVDVRDLTGCQPGEPVVALVPRQVAYREASDRLRAAAAAGVAVGAALVESDEGVLVANRTERLAVLDEIDVSGIAGATLVAVEVREPGHALTLLGDPVALTAALGLTRPELSDAAAATRLLAGCSAAAILLEGTARPPEAGRDPSWVETARGVQDLHAVVDELGSWLPGSIRRLALAGDRARSVADFFAVDLGAVADQVSARRPGLGSRDVITASLDDADPAVDPGMAVAAGLGVPTDTAGSEAAAARTGALTTAGADPAALVVDLGAGTLDVVPPDGAPPVIGAGGGVMLTAAVAALLGCPRAAADWAKRGPCWRVDAPQRVETEDGGRRFLDRPAPSGSVGMLVAPGPAGLLPFSRSLTPGEWRAIRLRLKEAVIGTNLRRLLSAVDAPPGQVLLVGGPAADDELVGMLAGSLPPGLVTGRALVGSTVAGGEDGRLGHRHAAALGLALWGAARV